MKTLRCLLIIALLLGFASETVYSQSRKLTKKGAELEKNGLPEEAADYYYKALLDKSDNIDALVGLKRTAPELLDRKLTAINSAYNNEDYQSAYDKYNEAVTYVSDIKEVSVELEIGKVFSDKYNECKSLLAEQYYASGKSQYDYGNFSEAICELEKCLLFRTPYKDAIDLLAQSKEAKNIADAERFYKAAADKFEAGDFRGAYHDFDSCLSYKSSYKDANDLKNEALEKGKVRIGIFEFTNDTKMSGLQGTLYSYVVTNAVNYNSPFIEVVDRDNLQRLLSEQKLGMSGVVDESTASRAGKVLGLDFVVLGRLISVTKTGGDPVAQKMTAYELYPAKTADGVDVQRGRSVNYIIHEGSLVLSYEAAYQLISIETSKIVTSDIVTSTASDQVKYATYNGDPKKLCKINPTDSFIDQFAVSNNMVDQRLFNSRQKLKTQEEVQPGLIRELAGKISEGICGQFK